MGYDKNQIFVMKAAPDQWVDIAGEIKSSMDYLWEKEQWGKIVNYSDLNGLKEKSPISRTWILLAGFALENLIKGTIIAQNPNYISNGRLSNKVSNHKLLELSNAIHDFTLGKDEQDLLNILESCILSWGRFPIPKKIEDLEEEVPANLDIKNIFDSFYTRLDRFLYDILKEDWQGPHECFLHGYIRSEMEEMSINDQNEIIDNLSAKMKNHSDALDENQ